MRQLAPTVVLLAAASFAYGDSTNQTVSPDVTQTVTLSNRDMNRIVCQTGDINDVYYSQEKGMLVEPKGANAFVKFLIRKKDGMDYYVDQEAELHIVCNGEVYTLVAHPQHIQTQTIYLSGGTKARIKENIELFRAMEKEEQLLTLTQAVYKDEIPDHYNITRTTGEVKVKPANQRIAPLFPVLRIERVKEVRVEGLGYRVSEYSIRALASVELLESDFAQKEFGADIAAITVHPLKLDKNGTARLIIIDEVKN